MTDLAANTIHKTAARGETMSFPINQAEVMYLGALVGLDSGTAPYNLTAWDDGTTSNVLCGILIRADSRLNDGVYTGNTADTPPPEGTVDISGVTIQNLTAVGGTPTGNGVLVYCADSNPANITINSSGMTHPIGIITRFASATDLDVTLFSMMEQVAQANA